MLRHMNFLDFAAAVFAGNAMTAAFLWGCFQLHKHDYKAPWLAYAAFIMPLGFFLISLSLTEGLPLQSGALAAQ